MITIPQTLDETAGRYFGCIRRRQVKTQTEIATMLHLSHAAISDIERGKTKMTLDLIYRLCEIYQLDTEHALINIDHLYRHFKEHQKNIPLIEFPSHRLGTAAGM